MKNSSKIKLILLIFLIIFFGFAFQYFYQSDKSTNQNDRADDDSGFNLFPFGDKETSDADIDDDKTEGTPYFSSKYKKEDLPKLRQISKIPTAGVVINAITKKELHELNVKNDIFNTEDALEYDDHISEIRYVSKKNGHIYSTYTNTTKDTRVSNTTIAKVYEAKFWDKNNLVVRYLDNQKNIKTYSIGLKKKTDAELDEEKKAQGDKRLKVNSDILNFGGVFLPLNIKEYSLLPNSKKIFYLREEEGSTIGIVAGSFGEDKKQIFKSGLHEWNINWKNKNNILLNSKSSSETYTLSFKLNAQNGIQSKVGEVMLAGNGLPNNNFTKILYSGKDYRGKFHLYVYDISKFELKDLGVQTLVEKCVWSKDNINVYCAVPDNGVDSDEPDRWYKGYTDFSDSILKLSVNNVDTDLIFDMYAEGMNFDIIDIKLDDFEDYVYFVDSVKGFAWSYKLPEHTVNFETEVPEKKEEFSGTLGGGNVCSESQTLTENLRSGDRNGKYSTWAKKTITEAKILQEHMNRLGFNAGAIDGILGKNSDASIKRMQKYLGTTQDGMVGPITRSLLNNSCN